MTTSICFYFQVHQPYRIKTDYSFFDMGQEKDFIDDKSNKEIINKVSNKCYLPTNNLLLKLIKKYPKKAKFNFSLSGTAIEQMEQYQPETLNSFIQLANTGNIEFLSETYYHSLASIFSKDEFITQIIQHREKIQEHFNQTPSIFRNTELIYNDTIANIIHDLGFKGILADGINRILNWRSPNFIYHPTKLPQVKLLLKNFKLSDDMAFRYPVFLRKNKNYFVEKLKDLSNRGAEFIGIFMDYETFGEHHWKDSGIFTFLSDTLEEIINSKELELVSLSNALQKHKSHGEIQVPETISWADKERDLSAWAGNPLQDATNDLLYSMESDIKNTNNNQIINDWRKLTTSDHSYYTCLKHYSDGMVHNYFSPFESPHEAFVAYSNAINQIQAKS